MGCCDGGEVIEDPFPNEVIEYIRDRLEANLVKQSTLNAELNNAYESLTKTKPSSDVVINGYSDLLINLTNTTTEKEQNNIKELLSNLMKLVNNNYFSFHTVIFEKLQGLKDYTNIKELIDGDSAFKDAIKENSDLLNEVFQDLKDQGINDISTLSFEKFKEACQKHGVKMTDDQLKKYYDLLKKKPNEGEDISKDVKKYLNSNPELKSSIEKNKSGIFKMIQKINKDGIDLSSLSFEDFKKLCKECGIKFSDKDLKEIYELIQKNFVGFINYMNKTYLNKGDNEDNLIRKAKKLNILASLDLQALPVAQKLERNF